MKSPYIFFAILFSSVSLMSCKELPKTTVSTISMKPAEVSFKEAYARQGTGKHILSDPDYYTWGTSVIKADDGKYHAYYSRWPKKSGFYSWLIRSEIAHAVSDNPLGPFEFENTVIATRYETGWNRVNAHNPCAVKVDGKILLYYISNNISKIAESEGQMNPYPSDEWLAKHRFPVRNTQCIALAVATNPSGPFERHSAPVVEPDGKVFHSLAANPAVIERDGTYYMSFKSDFESEEVAAEKQKDKKGFHRTFIHLFGISDKPEGPFKLNPKPILVQAEIEDSCLWYNENESRFNILMHSFEPAGIHHYTSVDGQDWVAANSSKLIPKHLPLQNGENLTFTRIERPFILTDDKGVPTHGYFTGLKANHSINFHVELENVPAPDFKK